MFNAHCMTVCNYICPKFQRKKHQVTKLFERKKFGCRKKKKPFEIDRISDLRTSFEKIRNSDVNIIEVITDSCMPCVFSGNIRAFCSFITEVFDMIYFQNDGKNRI